MSRKEDHIRIALNQSTDRKTHFDRIILDHHPLTEVNLNEVDLSTTLFGKKVSAPIFISSMTGGDSEGIIEVNRKLSKLARGFRLPLGVGSMRAVLEKREASYRSFLVVRDENPEGVIFANLGAQQLVGRNRDEILNVLKLIEADGLIVHLNPLQELIQPEGDKGFEGILNALISLKDLQKPIILKETGCGFGKRALQLIKEKLPFVFVDIGGLGGTHFGMVEKLRLEEGLDKDVASSFDDWGIDTVSSLILAKEILPHQLLIASGGIRNGIDIVKSLCLGAKFGGLAAPFLKSVNSGREKEFTQTLINEIKYAFVLLGIKNLKSLDESLIRSIKPF